MKALLQPAFILHSRPFRDTSVIVEAFSRDHGRLGLMVKGYKGARNRNRFTLDMFAPLLLSWQGRGELKFVTAAESAGPIAPLSGERLYCGLYSNEILIRLLPPLDPYPQLYDAYEELLSGLAVDMAAEGQLEPPLRQFEIQLLEQLGYGIDFSCVADTGEPILQNQQYAFVPDYGFTVAVPTLHSTEYFVCAGENLLAIASINFESPDTRRVAKRIMRLALQPHLGDKPLNSRKLFRR